MKPKHRKLVVGILLFATTAMILQGIQVVIAADEHNESDVESQESGDIVSNGDLKQKQKELDDLKLSLEIKQKQIEEREKLLGDQIARYEKTMRSLNEKGKVEESKKKETDQFEDFLKIYSKMEPKKAAPILDKIDVPLVGRLLRQMKPAQAAEILGKMNPAHAKEITEKYIRRTASNP